MKLMKWMIIPILFTLLVAGCLDEGEKESNGTDQLKTTPSPSPTETPPQTLTPSPTPTVTPSPTQTPTSTPTPVHEPQTYRVYVDSDYGFYMVRHIAEIPRTDLDVRDLKIRLGDTVIWRNDDEDSYRLKIVSKEGLWSAPDGVLMWYGKEFHYTFNETGVYTVSIGNYPKTANQTITVTE
ncbi:MAG: cupredoxin domain-containing protein [Methanosarcinales archaeon]